MRPVRVLSGVVLLAAVAVVATGQDKDLPGPEKPRPKATLPKGWDKLGLTDAQRAEVLKIGADHLEKRAKLLDELRKLDEDVSRKRVAILTDEQRKKLIELVSGVDPKGKADPKDKAKDK